MMEEMGGGGGGGCGGGKGRDLSHFLPALVKHRCYRLTSVHYPPVSVNMCMNPYEEEFALCMFCRTVLPYIKSL